MLVAIDLDGTLIDESLTISPEDRAAIGAASRNSFSICLASGRLFAACRPYAQELGLTEPVIALQGSVAYDPRSGERLFSMSLHSDTAIEAYDYLKARGFHMQLYFDDRLYLDELNDWARYYMRLTRVEPVMVEDLRKLLTGGQPQEPGTIKVLGIADPQLVMATIPLLARELGSRANVFRSLPPYLEVTHPNADKGHALRKIAQLLRIDMSRTAAIGDADNDVPMFQAAARSFAVANGTDAAKRSAGQIVPAVGSGVAFALSLLEEESAR